MQTFGLQVAEVMGAILPDLDPIPAAAEGAPMCGEPATVKCSLTGYIMPAIVFK